MSTLILCDIPDILRVGTPVWVRGLPLRLTGGQEAVHGVVLEVRERAECDILVAVSLRGCFWWPKENLGVRFNDATGRAHAAIWWLASQIFRVQPIERWAWQHQYGEREWGITHGYYPNQTDMQWWAPYENFGGGVVAALAELEPDDPQLLEDGSRRVDALAQKAVCLHVWKELQLENDDG